jgi:hypothetical protein
MSRKSIYWGVVTVLICWASLVIPGSAQHFEQVKGTLAQVSAGRNEVFGVDTKANVWRYHPTTKSFAKIAGVSLAQVAVGGGSVTQLDEVWGINSSFNVYRFNYTTKSFDQIPGAALTQITVGVGNEDQCHPYEVWGIASNQEVFRYDYCANKFNQSANSFLTSIATGASDVWGTINSEAYHYSFGQEQFVQTAGTMAEIAVGVNDVWGIDGSGDLYRYDPNNGGWNSFGSPVNQVAAGGDGVWVLSEGTVWRFDSSAEAFLEVPGELQSITVGSGAGIFGVNSSNQVFTWVRP